MVMNRHIGNISEYQIICNQPLLVVELYLAALITNNICTTVGSSVPRINHN